MRRSSILAQFLCLGLLVMCAGAARAQNQTDTGTSVDDLEDDATPNPAGLSQSQRAAARASARAGAELNARMPVVSQAGAVDPRTYRLGPGDVMQIDLWGRLARTIPLEVSPEGRVFLPNTGPLSVDGQTLEWVREHVMKMVAERFVGVKADVRLLRLRTFKVFVSGFVKNPGAVEANSAMRASEVVEPLGLIDGASERNIVVRHRDGTTAVLDLALFRNTGRQEMNPFLVDGDVIQVGRHVKSIEITGAVGRPQQFELGPQDSLSTLIQLAGGLLSSADPEQALLTRFRNASERESLWVRLDDVRAGTHDFPLQDGDHLFVQFRANFHVLPVVGIYGEVEKPGTYPIVIGKDRFSDLIRWSGGFRPLANQSAINLVRESEARKGADPEFDRLVRLSRSEMTESEYAKFQTRLAERTNSFRVDWNRLQKEGPDVDPLLQDGDVIRVDQLVPSIRIEGEVARPGFVDYTPGRDLNEYIALAGGYTDRASLRAVRVSRSLTGQVIPARSLKALQPGDFIWVPERRDVDAWAVFRDLVAVGGQIAVIIYTLSR